MTIEALEKVFLKALKDEDALQILDILDVVYNSQNYEIFELWRGIALPTIKKCQERDNDYYATGDYLNGFKVFDYATE